MKILARYVINQCTVMIMAYRDQKGHYYSKVFEGKEVFLVTMRPKALIEYSLNYYCSSLKGATEGTRAVLGNISMLPIMINKDLDLYWFPCFSPNREDCIWFSLSHIKNTVFIKSHQTKVLLNYNHSLILDMKKRRFEKKRQRASQLRYLMNER